MKAKLNPEKLPVYEIVVEDEDQTGIQLISLVDTPAIGVKGMFFSEDGQNQISYEFKEEGDKQMIVGPALIPNLKIRRKDENGNEYFVVFSKSTIEKMVEKFNRFGSNRRINADHTNRMIDAFIVEDWIVEDTVYDKSRKYGFEVPVGTYMIKVKIEDKDFWLNEVKEGKYGFSIEGLLSQMLISLNDLIEDTNEKIYSSYDEAFDDLDLIDLCELLELEDGEYPACTCGGEVKDFQFAKEGLVHPNCRCDLMMGDFQLSAAYLGKDGKEYPCEICNTAFRRWNSSGRFQDVFGNRFTKIDIYPYYIKRS